MTKRLKPVLCVKTLVHESVHFLGGSHHPVGYLVNTHKPSKKGQRKNLRTSYRLAPRNCSVNVAKLQNIYRDNQAINRDSVTDIIFQDQYKFFTSGTGDW